MRHTIPLYGICEHILSHHDHSNSYVFHVVHCRPKNFEFPNHCDMKLVTLNYGISTTQTETRPIPNPQGNADAISELFFQISGLLPGNWMLPGAVSNHPSPLCNKSELIELDTTNTLTDGRFMFIILWQTRKIKSLFTPKDKIRHKSNVIYRAECTCGETSIVVSPFSSRCFLKKNRKYVHCVSIELYQHS